MKRVILLAVAAAMTMAFATPAVAKPAGAERGQSTVNHADLNLSQEDDARTLLRRFRGAAQSICGDRHERRPLYMTTRIRACVRASMEHAVTRTNSPLVTQLYYQRQPAVTVVAAN